VENIDEPDEFSDTPLLLAVRKGHLQTVRLLIDKGANINYKNPSTGETPLIRAAKAGHEDVVKLLLEKGASVAQTDNTGGSVVTWACRKGFVGTLKILIDHGLTLEDSNQFPPLLVASSFGSIDVIRFLISKKFDVNIQDDQGRTPLIMASIFGHTTVLDLLVENNATLDLKDNNGGTAIYHAARMGQTRCLKRLIERGAQVNIPTLKNETPLFRCAFNDELADLVLSRGGNILDVEFNEDQFNFAAHSYEWFAIYFEKKLSGDCKNREDIVQKVAFSYKLAAKYFEKASLEMEKIADELRADRITKVVGSMVLNSMIISLSHMQAQVEAKQRAELSALRSPNGVGTGSGHVFYQTFVPNTTGIQGQESQYREKAKEFNDKADECKQRLIQY